MGAAIHDGIVAAAGAVGAIDGDQCEGLTLGI